MKSQTYPETVPDRFSHDALSAAYRRGWNRGHGIASHTVPKSFASEVCSRDFIEFLVTCERHELGEGSEDTPSSDEAWEAYGAGVADSIFAELQAENAALRAALVRASGALRTGAVHIENGHPDLAAFLHSEATATYEPIRAIDRARAEGQA